jgi:hypothetical protein
MENGVEDFGDGLGELVNGTTHRLSTPSPRRPCGDETLPTLVTPESELCPRSGRLTSAASSPIRPESGELSESLRDVRARRSGGERRSTHKRRVSDPERASNEHTLEASCAKLEPPVADADAILFSEAIEAEGALVFAKAREMGLEGIVSKRLGGRYRSGRCRNWVKIKSPACERNRG